jgi:transcription initiation factor TFIIIB Brf1 subunit/transcription initiation factor TFIIB
MIKCPRCGNKIFGNHKQGDEIFCCSCGLKWKHDIISLNVEGHSHRTRGAIPRYMEDR